MMTPEEKYRTKGYSMWKFPASLISWISTPFAIPTYAMMLIFHFSILTYIPPQTKLSFVLIIFSITMFLPLGLVLLMSVMGAVRDSGLNNRHDRAFSYIAISAALIGVAFFLQSRHAPHWVSMYYAGAGVSSIIGLIINTRRKICAHSIGLSSLVALLLSLMRYEVPQNPVELWLLSIVLLAGIVGTSRIYLNQNTLEQVLAGYCVGFGGTFLMMLL